MLDGELQKIAILVQDRRHQMKEVGGRQKCANGAFLLQWGERTLTRLLRRKGNVILLQPVAQPGHGDGITEAGSHHGRAQPLASIILDRLQIGHGMYDQSRELTGLAVHQRPSAAPGVQHPHGLHEGNRHPCRSGPSHGRTGNRHRNDRRMQRQPHM